MIASLATNNTPVMLRYTLHILQLQNPPIVQTSADHIARPVSPLDMSSNRVGPLVVNLVGLVVQDHRKGRRFDIKPHKVTVVPLFAYERSELG